MISRPSDPPSSAATGSNDAATGSVGTTSERTYGRLATIRSNGSATTGGSRSATAKRINSATPWPAAFSLASCSASAEASVAKNSTSWSAPRSRSATARLTRTVPAPASDRTSMVPPRAARRSAMP